MEARTGTTVEILEPHECWSLLRTARVGRLAVSVAGRPDIFPVNHIVDHGTIVFRTAPGTKLAAAVLGRGVAFEVDGFEPDEGVAWSVVVKGSAFEVHRLEEYLEMLDLPLFPWLDSPKPNFVRIEPESVTGRRFAVSQDAQVPRTP